VYARSDDSGQSFTPINLSASRQDAIFVGQHDMYYQTDVAGSKAALANSSNLGEHWTSADTGLPNSFGIRSIAFGASAPQVGYALVTTYSETLLYRTDDGGQLWRPVVTQPASTLDPEFALTQLAIDPADPAHAYVAGNTYLIDLSGIGLKMVHREAMPKLFETHDSGVTWMSIHSRLPGSL
jgi:photosystem II stability/assembly factor-like uncharacterized protein